MLTTIVTLPAFRIIGYKIEANVEAFESGKGKEAHSKLLARKHDIPHRKHDHVMLMQIYPMDEHFDAQQDVFTHLIGYEVTQTGSVPEGMVEHAVEASEYVTCTHKGMESDIYLTYEYLYGRWLNESGKSFKDYDFEIWDARYDPESGDNEIDVYIALE